MGCNWNNLDEAKAMIDKCAEHGFKFAKFQLFKDEGQGLPEHLYLTEGQAQMLFDYGKALNVEVFFTCMFAEAVDWCERIGVGRYKIRYMDRNNQGILKKVLDTKKPYFISMNLEDNPLFGYGYEQRKVLFCQPYYPCGIGDYVFNSSIIFDGISDHTKDLELLKLALDTHNTNPFKYWEKHMKLDSVNRLEDMWSVTFEELASVRRNYNEIKKE